MNKVTDMTAYVALQMWEPFRKILIDSNLFYAEQARARILSQFDNIETEANEAAERWLERNSRHFDPDRHDPDSFYESAQDEGIEFYRLLSEMRDQTRLSLVAGMFHEWDKQLRDWLAVEIRHWHHADGAVDKIWSASFEQLIDLLGSLSWNVRTEDYLGTIEACGLVVNVYKHGKGRSLEKIKQKHPQYLSDPLSGARGAFLNVRHLDHTHLRVSDEQFQTFADAITTFWREVPAETTRSDKSKLPTWFRRTSR